MNENSCQNTNCQECENYNCPLAMDIKISQEVQMKSKIKQFFESLLSKKGCANCINHTTNREHRIVCSLSEKERAECQSCDKHNEIYRHWKAIEKK